MKLVTLFAVVCASANLFAQEVLWQAEVPGLGPEAYAGKDGSALAFANGELIWFSADGTVQHREAGSYDNVYHLSSDRVIIEKFPDQTLVLRKEAEGVQAQVLAGNPSGPGTPGYYPYFAIANGTTVTMYKVPEVAGENQQTLIPNNSIVIPSSFTGEVEVVLESSEDLVNWTPATPGIYTVDGSFRERFFRVRATTR